MAEGNGDSVAETLDIIRRTVDIDRVDHVQGYESSDADPVPADLTRPAARRCRLAARR